MSESELISGNITTPLLLIVVVILGLSAFFFLELRKIHRKIDALQSQGPPVGPRPGPAQPSHLPVHSPPITQSAPCLVPESQPVILPHRVPEPQPVILPQQIILPQPSYPEPHPEPIQVPGPDSESMIRELMEGLGSPQAPVGDLSSLIPSSKGTDTDTDTEDLTKMTVSQLKAVLQSRKLPTTGNKQKLIKRLQGGEDSPTRSLNVTDALLHVHVPEVTNVPEVMEPGKDLNLAHVARV